MKKITAAALCLLLLCASLLASCQSGDGKDEENAFFREYLIFEGENNGISSIMKLNVETGTITTLCEDPLCRHDAQSDCLFKNASSSFLYTDNGNIYYSIPDNEMHTRTIMKYDVENATASEIYTFESTEMPNGSYQFSVSHSISNGYLWATTTNYEDMSKKSFRVRLSDKKYEEVSPDLPRPLAKYNGSYLFHTTDYLNAEDEDSILGFYLGDIDGNIEKRYANDKVIQIVFGDFIEDDVVLYACPHKKENGKYDWSSQTLYSCNLKTGEETVVHEKFGDVYFLRSGEYIYYANWIDDKPIIGYNENDKENIYNGTGGIIWRMNIYTGEEEKYLEMPEYNLKPTGVHKVGDKMLFEYINVDYDDYKIFDNGWYDYKETGGWLIFSPEDGIVKDVVNTAYLYD